MKCCIEIEQCEGLLFEYLKQNHPVFRTFKKHLEYSSKSYII